MNKPKIEEPIPSTSKVAIPVSEPKHPRHSLPHLVTQYQNLFDLAMLPPRPKLKFVAQSVHLFDFGSLPSRNMPPDGIRTLISQYLHLFDFATLPPKRATLPPKRARVHPPIPTRDGPLLEAPVFKQCVWSTEFFDKATRLDTLLTDPTLVAYFPFIHRLHKLNEGGYQALGLQKQIDSLIESTSVSHSNETVIHAWGCVLRFLVLDMLLRSKGYKASPALISDGSLIARPAHSFTGKMYKWQKYLADVTGQRPPAENILVAADAAAPFVGPIDQSSAAKGQKNLLITALSMISIIEEPFLQTSESADDPVLPSRLTKPGATYKLGELPRLTPAKINRHLAIWFFISPLAVLMDRNLDAPIVSMQHLFLAARALGTARPPRIELAEKYLRGVMFTLLSDPALDVPAAFATTDGAPRYMPPPYNETFFNAGAPLKFRYD
ncbi:hypothetical protein B0H11DRAFT_1955197 [Mycena galericulata]|nr:hypothetical protein B0H11DRAFT_1955197 [Mycena galericulata]